MEKDRFIVKSRPSTGKGLVPERHAATEIVVMLKPDYLPLFLNLLETPLDPVVREIKAVLDEFSLTIRQMHPGIHDPIVEVFFVVRGKGAADPENIARKLRGCRAVDGAYVAREKPAP